MNLCNLNSHPYCISQTHDWWASNTMLFLNVCEKSFWCKTWRIWSAKGIQSAWFVSFQAIKLNVFILSSLFYAIKTHLLHVYIDLIDLGYGKKIKSWQVNLCNINSLPFCISQTSGWWASKTILFLMYVKNSFHVKLKGFEAQREYNQHNLWIFLSSKQPNLVPKRLRY